MRQYLIFTYWPRDTSIQISSDRENLNNLPSRDFLLFKYTCFSMKFNIFLDQFQTKIRTRFFYHSRPNAFFVRYITGNVQRLHCRNISAIGLASKYNQKTKFFNAASSTLFAHNNTLYALAFCPSIGIVLLHARISNIRFRRTINFFVYVRLSRTVQEIARLPDTALDRWISVVRLCFYIEMHGRLQSDPVNKRPTGWVTIIFLR